MSKAVPKYLGLFILLATLQVLLFNNIQLSGYINPYVYVLFILLLPFETSGWILLFLAFSTGLTIDAFMNTFGMHSSATLIMAFARPYLITFLADREDFEKKGTPSMSKNGAAWFVRYAFILVLIHHFSLFLIESFSFINIFDTLLRTILSTLTTTIFIVVGQFIFLRK